MIASLYLPYEALSPPPSEEMRRLVEYCDRHNQELLAGADANSHNEIWGNMDTNTKGEYLLNYIATTKLDILDRGYKPTYVNSIREEVIDVLQATPHIAATVLNRSV